MRKKSKMGTKMRAMGPGMKSGRSTSDKLKMVTNDKGKEVPFFAADGKGKMAGGGKTETATKMVPKGYFKGGKVMDNPYGGLAGHTPKPFPGKRGVGAPPRAKRGGKG